MSNHFHLQNVCNIFGITIIDFFQEKCVKNDKINSAMRDAHRLKITT